jgi:hypothetical protein
MKNGETLINDIYNMFSKSRLWYKTMMIITYDEHGGRHDHVYRESLQWSFAIHRSGHRLSLTFEGCGIRPYLDHRDWIYSDQRDVLGPIRASRKLQRCGRS